MTRAWLQLEPLGFPILAEQQLGRCFGLGLPTGAVLGGLEAGDDVVDNRRLVLGATRETGNLRQVLEAFSGPAAIRLGRALQLPEVAGS